ncbi:MAG: hypothetical protein ACKN9T_13080 [Candidatus Methylumidiphilus sp.]
MATAILKMIDTPDGRVAISLETEQPGNRPSRATEYANNLHTLLLEGGMDGEPRPEAEPPQPKVGSLAWFLAMAGYGIGRDEA